MVAKKNTIPKGAPWYMSPIQKWNGTIANLKKKPLIKKIVPIINSIFKYNARFIKFESCINKLISLIFTLPKIKYIIEIPNPINAAAITPKIKKQVKRS